MEIPIINEVYRILNINPVCEWYLERELFEGKLMKCIEVFKNENSAGYIFTDRSDYPEGYDHSFAFCLSKPKIERVK